MTRITPWPIGGACLRGRTENFESYRGPISDLSLTNGLFVGLQ